MVVDPLGTLLKTSLLSFLAGAGWALLGALLIYLGSIKLEPRVHPSRVWSDWRLHRMLWAVGVVVPVLGAYLTAEYLVRSIGLRDLYWWVAQRTDIVLIGRLGAASGYLLVACILVWMSRRRAKDQAGRARRGAGR